MRENEKKCIFSAIFKFLAEIKRNKKFIERLVLVYLKKNYNFWEIQNPTSTGFFFKKNFQTDKRDSSPNELKQKKKHIYVCYFLPHFLSIVLFSA